MSKVFFYKILICRSRWTVLPNDKLTFRLVCYIGSIRTVLFEYKKSFLSEQKRLFVLLYILYLSKIFVQTFLLYTKIGLEN